MNAFGNQAQGGSKPDPLAFFPGVCSGGYLFSSEGPTPTTPSPPPIFTLPSVFNSFSVIRTASAKTPFSRTAAHIFVSPGDAPGAFTLNVV